MLCSVRVAWIAALAMAGLFAQTWEQPLLKPARPPLRPVTQPTPQPIDPVAVTAPADPPDPPHMVEGLNLNNALLTEVIDQLARTLTINYVLDPSVQGGVYLNTYGEPKGMDARPLLDTILRINGFAMLQTGDFYRIVPLSGLSHMPLAAENKTNSNDIPPDDQPTLNLVFLKYATVDELAKVLSGFTGEGARVISYAPANLLFILDSHRSMRRTMDLIAMFDSDILANQRLRLFEIKHGRPSDIAEELSTILKSVTLSDKPAPIRFVPVDRINTLVVIAPNPGVFGTVENWVDKLDVPVRNSGRLSGTYVYRLKFGRAECLGPALAQLYGSFAGGGGVCGGMMAASFAPPRPASGAAPAQIPRIVPNPLDNSLLIQASPNQYQSIVRLLAQIDVPPRQILLEAKIYEVSLTGAFASGVTAMLQKLGAGTAALNTRQLQSTLSGGSTLLSAGSLAGASRELLAFVSLQENATRARVLSAPSLIATDSIAASITAGNEVPTLTAQAAGNVQAGGNSTFTQSIQTRQTGVTLNVLAHVNPSGAVTLIVNQEVSAPQPPAAAASIQTPSFSKRSVQTQITMRDGDTIAIGGIINESSAWSTTGIPGLNRLPLIGGAFGSKSYSKDRTELIVFMTPHVIHDNNNLQEASEELKARLKKSF